MDIHLLTTVRPILAIQISTILLMAGVICAVIAVIGLVMKKKPSKSPDRSAEPSENLDCTAVAADILAAVGGKENISAVDCCAACLRFEIKDYTAINEKAVKAAGASGVTRPTKNSCKVVIGTRVQFVYDALKKML